MQRFPLVDSWYCTQVATYAPTIANIPEKIDFYNQLNEIFYVIPNADKIIYLGDFNAWVG